MSRAPRRFRMSAVALAPALALALSLQGCRGEDAYLGGSQETYVCGSRCWIEQGAPSDAGDWFFNPEATRGELPEIVYPLADSVHPSDLRRLTVQFKRGRADLEVYRVRIEQPESGVAYDFFTRCIAVGTDGCRYLLEGGLWDDARAELLDKRARFTVAGSTARHGLLKVSQPVEVQVVSSELKNKGFYYWSTVRGYNGDADTAGIYRLPFGADEAQPFIMPGERNNRECGACHSVSADGSTIAFTTRAGEGGPDQRSGTLVAEGTAQPETPLFPVAPPDTYDSSTMALTSDGRRVLVAFGDTLALRTTNKDDPTYSPGATIRSLVRADLLDKLGYFPEFSPSDDAVVLTLSDQPDSAIAVQSGDIGVLPFDSSRDTFGAPRIIVPGTEDTFNFYPTWSPDGRYIAFASASREAGPGEPTPKSYDQQKARLRLVRRTGGTVYDLERAVPVRDRWSTYPKFAPFSAGRARALMFLTFNSKMSYGLLLDNDARENSVPGRIAQLWMSAIDVSRVEKAQPEDPSSPPIWLPFQDPNESGHLGIWTREVRCRPDLGSSACGFGQRCDQDTKTCVVDDVK